MANKEFFLTVTQRIFSNWTALKLAVEHDMGPKDSAVEFCQYMTEVLYMNDQLSNSEIATVLEDYMADNFNTELEDESATQVAEELLKFYQCCTTGNETTAIMELEKLPPLQSWLVSVQPIQHNRSSAIMNRDDNSSSDEDTNNMNTCEADEEGWTVIKSGRKR